MGNADATFPLLLMWIKPLAVTQRKIAARGTLERTSGIMVISGRQGCMWILAEIFTVNLIGVLAANRSSCVFRTFCLLIACCLIGSQNKALSF